MALSVTLDLSNEDLAHFRSLLRQVRSRTVGRPPGDVVTSAAREVARLRSKGCSPFIRRHLERVERMVAMLEDPQWALPELERRRVLEGLAYVAELHDLVPDDVPVLGLLDDAIMLELVLRDLRHELEAYEEFAAYRATETARAGRSVRAEAVSRQDWLDARREALHERMRERRERDLAGHGHGFELITRF
jgi:uncharacterized membrane protein YkvA (DUF1232 family)